MKNLFFTLIIALGLFSCTKPPGEGGNSSIRGSVSKDIRLVLTNPSSFQYSQAAVDETVYIIYGDHISPDDDVDTNFDGEFEFRNLRPGDYTIYVYSEDTTGLQSVDNNRMPIIREVTISDRKEEIDLGEIKIYEEN